MDARFLKLGPVTLLLGTGLVAGCSGSNTPAAPTVSFSQPSSASAIDLGQALALNWNSTNATSCTGSTASGGGSFSGSQALSGSASVAPTAQGSVSYTLSCSGPGGTASATSPTITVNPNLLSTLGTISTIGNTFTGPMDAPTGGGFNPYGLAIAPVSSGLISAGDLIVCNFNDAASNVQGLGTTVVGLHPSAAANTDAQPYLIANSPALEGCNAITVLPDDSISAAAFQTSVNPLVSPTGVVSNPYGSDSFSGTWGEAYVAATAGHPAALYVSNVGGGSIDRITLDGDNQTAFTEIAAGFCGAGSPGAIYAPSGLTYDASIDTLYVVDTSSYSVIAFANVSAIGKDGVVVDGNCDAVAATPTPQPIFSGPSAASARVIANGGGFDAPISAALLKNGDLIVGNGDIDAANFPVSQYNEVFEISPSLGFVGQPLQLDNSGTSGALFGIAATVDGNGNQLIYFNDDNASSVNLLSK